MSHDIRKFMAGLGVLGALGLGGAAIAGAAGNGNTVKAAPGKSGSAEAPGSEAKGADEASEQGESRDHGESKETERPVSAADRRRAERAALAAVGGGTVGEVEAETPDPAGGSDKPEKGEAPDPAYEQRIAYDVEVTKTDGREVDVHLDRSFHVLGTEQGDQNEQG